jgi:hypothetical protein
MLPIEPIFNAISRVYNASVELPNAPDLEKLGITKSTKMSNTLWPQRSIDLSGEYGESWDRPPAEPLLNSSSKSDVKHVHIFESLPSMLGRKRRPRSPQREVQFSLPPRNLMPRTHQSDEPNHAYRLTRPKASSIWEMFEEQTVDESGQRHLRPYQHIYWKPHIKAYFLWVVYRRRWQPYILFLMFITLFVGATMLNGSKSPVRVFLGTSMLVLCLNVPFWAWFTVWRPGPNRVIYEKVRSQH